jgi:hypothetical protein
MKKTEKTVTTNWNAILESPHMKKILISFSLGMISRDDFYNWAVFSGCGPHVRRLLRNKGVAHAREIARKMLKRRGLINNQNLVKPTIYAQL